MKIKAIALNTFKEAVRNKVYYLLIVVGVLFALSSYIMSLLTLGDKVKVMTGQYKGKEAKVEAVDIHSGKIMLTGIEISKKDGSKARPMIHASNIMITEAKVDDKKRFVNKKLVDKKQVQSKQPKQS